MTIISSGQLALQDAGTNPSETVNNKLLDTTMTTGLDALLTIRQRNEVGDGTFSNVLMWQGDLYGYNQTASNFSSSYIHNLWSMNTALGIQGELRGYSSQSAFGSLGTTTYSDKSSVNRTIRFLLWGLPDASPSPNTNTRIFGFALSGSGVTNSDNTFEKIKITTNSGTVVTIDRDDLTYDAYENGNSWWEWHGTSGTVYNAITSLGTPSSNTSYDVEIISGTTTTTSNNGIAEEMGGADSSDVKMSDYYSPGTFIGSGLSGVPSSGEIKFSDFYGKTHIGFVTSSVEVQPAAKYQVMSGPRGGQYEHILHGFGPTYSNTYSSSLTGFNSAITSSTKTDSAQGSLIGSPTISQWGASSSFGTLRALLHFTYGPAGSSHGVMMVVEATGSDSNSGFTNLTITRSGMTTLTLPRASATYTYVSSGTARIWRWNNTQVSAISNYRSGTPASQNVDSLIFPGGAGSGSANTTTLSRSTWTLT